MPDMTDTMHKIHAKCEQFRMHVDDTRGWGGARVPGRQAELIDQLVSVFEFFWVELGLTDRERKEAMPFLCYGYTDQEKHFRVAAGSQIREEFVDLCRMLAEALATDNRHASRSLFALAFVMEEQETERMPIVWREVKPSLACVLAQLEARPTQSGKPQLTARQQEVLKIIQDHEPIQEKDIIKKLTVLVQRGTIRRWDIDVLKKHFSVVSTGDGYKIKK